MATCNATPIVSGGPTLFHNTRYIVRSHNYAPRFGFPNNLTEALSQDATHQERVDYIKGLLMPAIVMFAFFTVWLLFLITMRCCGYKRVGFWAGTNMILPRRPAPPSETTVNLERNDETLEAPLKESNEIVENEPETATAVIDNMDVQKYQQELKQWEHEAALRNRRLRNIRIAVLISGCTIVAFCIVMIVEGVLNLNYAIKSTRSGIEMGINLANEAISIIDTYEEAQNAVLTEVNTTSVQLNHTCSKVVNYICSDVLQLSNCTIAQNNVAPTVSEIRSVIYSQVQQFMYQQLDPMRSDCEELAKELTNLNNKFGQFYWAFWVATGFAILLAVLSLSIIYGVISAWRQQQKHCITSFVRGWLIIPLITFLVVMSWIFSMLFVIGSLATADACYNSPDQLTLMVLYEHEDLFNSLFFQFAIYYVSGCLAVNQPYNASEAFGQAQQLLETVAKVKAYASASATAIEAVCSAQNVTMVEALASALESQVCVAVQIVTSVNQFFACHNWQPLYATIAYQAVCYEGNQGFFWISLSQFIVVFFAMIILTLRIGFAPMIDEEDVTTKTCLRICCCRKHNEAAAVAAKSEAEKEPNDQMQEEEVEPETTVVTGTVADEDSDEAKDHAAVANTPVNAADSGMIVGMRVGIMVE